MSRVDLQELLFPDNEICSEESLYFRAKPFSALDFDNEDGVKAHIGDELDSSTYFNSFSIEKWRKYTRINHLNVELTYSGKGLLLLKNAYISRRQVIEHVVGAYSLDSSDQVTQSFQFPDFDEHGIDFFDIQIQSEDFHLYKGCYYSNVDFDLVFGKNAINMCTYKREKYVYRNFEIMNKYFLAHPEYKSNFDIYLTDNGESINKSIISEDNVFVNYQHDSGATGGFTRGLIEIIQSKIDYQRVIMMDDDITFHPEVLVRTCVFSSMLKQKYSSNIIAGAMLRMDIPTIQSEAGGYIDSAKYKSIKQNLHLGDLYSILYSNIDECANVSAWWYSAIPMSYISSENLPFPYYFHREDMDYSVRTNKEVITMNGICVWHEPFEFKISLWQKYYDVRNMIIFNSLHFPHETRRHMNKTIRKLFVNSICTYRYEEMRNISDAVRDYLKGPEWLTENDDSCLLESKMANHYTVQTIDFDINYDEYNKSVVYDEKLLTKIIRHISLNGYLLPANHNICAISSDMLNYASFRVKTIYNLNLNSRTYFITEKNYKDAFHALCLYIIVQFKLWVSYKRVSQKYRDEFSGMITEEYWKQKLDL